MPVRGWIAMVLWLCCACTFAAVPERPRFRMVGAAQGLPSTDIKALVRDADGYLWIGTADGLARYDGVGMRVWRHDPANPRGLPGNNVQALMVDGANRLWIAVEGAGISVLDARREAFVHYRQLRHPQIGSDDTWAFARQGNTVWFGTYEGGLHRIGPEGRIRGFRHDPNAGGGLPSDTILALLPDAWGALWIGTDAGLAQMQGGVIETVRLPGAAATPMVFSIRQQADGIWVGTSEGVWLRDVHGRWRQPAWSAMFQRPNAMLDIVRDADGSYWIASQRGLWRQRGVEAPIPVRMGGPEIPRVIVTLLAQGNGGLWVPVAGAGLGFLRADWRAAAVYAGAADGLQGGIYRALAPARAGGIWLGGFNGVVERLAPDGSVMRLDGDSQVRLQGMKLFAITEDDDGRLWLAHRGLVRIGLDGAIDEWRAGDEADAPPAGTIHQMQLADDGSLWLWAPGGGVQQRNTTTGKVMLDIAAGEEGGLGTADIEALEIAPRGDVWIAGSQGVARLDRVHRRFRPVPELGAGRVYAIAFDGDDSVWLQRITGIEQHRRHNGRWELAQRVDAARGMPAVAASGMRIDRHHRVWVSTSRGLYRWEPRAGALRRFGGQDAANSQEFLDRAVAMSPENLLAVASADGSVLLVDTDANDASAETPLLRYDRVSVRRSGRWKPVPLRPTLQLDRDDRELRIVARVLAFEDPSSNRYWSMLEGFDREWIALGSSGERVFTGLAPGTYALRMRARDGAGNAAREQRIHLTIPPPWWATPWARVLLGAIALLLIATVAAVYRARLKRRHAWQLAEAKRVLAEQSSEAKSRFLATLGHEVRTPMTGVLGMSELLQGTTLDTRQRSHVDAIRRAGEHLLRLVNDALDLARIEAGKLELVNADFALRPLLDEVAALMAPVAERKGLQFVDALDPDTPQALHGDRTRLQQILLNLLGNAIKFTEQGHVGLEVGALQPRGVRIVVSDSGPGLSAEQMARLFRRFEQADGAHTAARYGGSGLGLAISQELAAAMGGRINVLSDPGQGSRFIVELPLATAELPPTDAPPVIGSNVPTLQGLRLLLVEDDPIVAQALQGLLGAQGHGVVHAGHGLAALAEAAVQVFDAGLLDLDLPGMDGLALARTLRTQGFKAPLLAVTARSDGDAEAQAQAAGFEHFLRKPVTGAMLDEALRRVLRV